MGIFEKKSIKIEKEDLKDAKLSSVDFKDENIKRRAFMNVLGARLAIKMLFSKKIKANNVYSLYTINNILKGIDISDIYFDGIKIDVRLVFNKDEIFIPKSHFEYGLTPDLYLALEISKDFLSADLLGYFEPDAIDKEYQNENFYFIPYENINDSKNIKSFLKNFKPKDIQQPSEEDAQTAEELFLQLIDGDISEDDKKFLLQNLTNNLDLREKIVEFENFELISGKIAKSENIIQDGILDIVGAQRVHEGEDTSSTEERAEIIGEVLTGLLEDGLGEKEKSIEIVEDEKSFEDEINEMLKEKEKEKESNAGALVGGIAIGGAIAGAAGLAAASAAGAAASQESLIDAAANITSAGINAAESLINNIPKAEFAEEDFSIEDNEIENLLSQEPEASSFNDEMTFDEDEIEKILSQEPEITSFKDEIAIDEDEIENLLNSASENEISDDEFASLTEEETPTEMAEESTEEVEAHKPEESYEPSEIEILQEDTLADEDLFSLPEINFGEEETPAAISAEKLPESKEESSDDNVISLDDFNFDDFKSDNDDESEPEVYVPPYEDEAIETPAYLSMAQDIETEFNAPESIEATEEPATPEIVSGETSFTEADESDYTYDDEDLESDTTLSDIENSINGLELTDEQKALLENALSDYNPQDEVIPGPDSDLVDGLFSDESLYNQASNLEKLQQEAVEPPIDNVTPENMPVEDEELLQADELYEKLKGSMQSPKASLPSLLQNNKKLVLATSVAGLILLSAIIGSTTMNKNGAPQSNQPQSVTNNIEAQNPASQIAPNTPTDASAPDESQNIGPDITSPDAAQQAPQSIPGEAQQQNRDMGKAMSDAFLSEPVNTNISKIAWEVPEDLAYNDTFRKYLQVAGKNLKLNLQNDLLLATEMAYSSKVVIDLGINKDGSLKSETVITSSGSKQIDKIVLQSVKETLKYLKMPTGELAGTSINATVIINF